MNFEFDFELGKYYYSIFTCFFLDERNEYDGEKCRVQDLSVDHPYPEFTENNPFPGGEWSDSEYSDYGLIR